MGFWQTILISAGLSLDVFAYCLYRGAMISEVKKAEITKVIAIFTAFQVGMLLIGNLITRIPAIRQMYQPATRLWSFLAAVTFFSLGFLMIAKSFRRRKRRVEEQKQDNYNYKVILLWAFITSIDALIAGIGFGFMGLKLLGTGVIMAIITALAGITGFSAGYWLGCGPMNTCVTVGGCLVLVGGVDLLVKYQAAVF